MTRFALAAAIAGHGVIHLNAAILGGAAWVARSRTHLVQVTP